MPGCGCKIPLPRPSLAWGNPIPASNGVSTTLENPASQVSVFPQLFLNNPNDAVRRGITPATNTFLLPFEFSKKFGPVDVDYEIGYQFTHKGPDGWLTGLVLGHDFTSKFEMDMEFYSQGAFHPSDYQPTIGVGARYKIHRPVILLLMTGRSLEPAAPISPISLVISDFNFCCLPSPINPIVLIPKCACTDGRRAA
jgi:hypothetical protein